MSNTDQTGLVGMAVMGRMVDAALAAPPKIEYRPVVKNPRDPQWAEALVHVEAALVATGDEAEWHEGASIGYLTAFTGTTHLNQFHDLAKSVRGAAPFTFEEAQVVAARGRAPVGCDLSLFEACGVLFGYKEATSEEVDAVSCSNCDRRVLLARDDMASCRYHGEFCDNDCADQVCDRGCVLRDDRSCHAPDWWIHQEELAARAGTPWMDAS